MAGDIVIYANDYPAAVITLNHPAARNALSAEMISALGGAVSRAESDPNVRAIIITGADPAFCGGMDLHELRTLLDPARAASSPPVWETARMGEELLDRIYQLSKPTIAALNGDAAGGGAGLASVCDLAVAAADARIGYPEMKLGIQSAAVVVHLMRLVGEREARYLILTGELVGAERARQMGIINEVVPRGELRATALKWARQIALNAPEAESISKTLLRRFSAESAAMATPEYLALPYLTDECRAGLEAFFARRPVPWAPT
jgi:methylglutaconyl-CoA hydratase